MSDFQPDTPSTYEFPAGILDVKIFALGCDFLMPYLKLCGNFTDQPEEAAFVLAMNNTEPGAAQAIADIRRCSNRPVAWWTIEDPNWFEAFFDQACQADFIFTTDEACMLRYCELLSHNRIFSLPLACCPSTHQPLELVPEASDFVLSGNWYANEARLWAVKTLIDPLLDSGRTLKLFCYESFMWPDPYCRFWLREEHYLKTAEQYRHGRVVLGLNNQRSGMDGFERTYMTSMRTFEALACGKPFLSSHSDAYEKLGFINGKHMVWVDHQADTLTWADRLLSSEGDLIAQEGRRFVLAHHTYANRLAKIVEVVLG